MFSDAEKFSDKLSEAALLAISVLLSFPVVLIWNWILAPSLLDFEQAERLSVADEKVNQIAARDVVQNWLIERANTLNELERSLYDRNIEPSAYLEQFKECWDQLTTELREGHAPSWVVYNLENITVQGIEAILNGKVSREYGVDEDSASEINKNSARLNNLRETILRNGKSE